MKYLNYIEKYLVYLSVFLLPLLYFPSFSNTFETPKLIVTSVLLLIIFIIKLSKILISDNLTINVSKYDLILISISLAFIASAYFATASKFEAFVNTGNATFVILGTIFYLIINQLKNDEKKTISYLLIFSSMVMSILIIFNFANVKNIPLSTFGNLVSTALLILTSLILSGFDLINQEKLTNKISASLASLLLIIGFGLSIYLLTPNKPTSIKVLPIKTSWQIAADSIKESPLFGIGPSNYIDAFNKFRPISFNSTSDWNLKYIYSSSLFLTILTEAGILTTVLLTLIFYISLKNLDFKNPTHISILVSTIAIILLPITYSFIPFLFILLSLSTNKVKVIENQFNSKIPTFLITIPLFSLLIFGSYLTIRITLGEIYFSKSILETTKSNPDTKLVYDLAQKAVRMNKYSDKYRLLLSNVSYSIANGISKNKDLSEEDKKLIAQLIQQSIAEAKAAVAVNSTRASNWQNLGQIYLSMIPYAKGSEVFAEEAYKQAIFADPLNPIIRVNLGGVYYMQKKYDLAIDTLKLATIAKGDFANAHYNLSYAYRGKGDLAKAKEEMTIVLELLGKDSANYQQALKELESMEELTKPEEKPASVEPQVELPQN